MPNATRHRSRTGSDLTRGQMGCIPADAWNPDRGPGVPRAQEVRLRVCRGTCSPMGSKACAASWLRQPTALLRDWPGRSAGQGSVASRSRRTSLLAPAGTGMRFGRLGIVAPVDGGRRSGAGAPQGRRRLLTGCRRLDHGSRWPMQDTVAGGQSRFRRTGASMRQDATRSSGRRRTPDMAQMRPRPVRQ